MVASGKTPGLPYAKSNFQRSNPRFRPAQVSQRRCHARIHCRRPEGGSRSAAKDSRELRLGPMRSGYLCPLGSGPGDHEIPQLHQAIARAGALRFGRRQSGGGEHGPPAARLQLPARQRRPALGDFHAKRSGSFCQDARSDAGFPCARIPGPDGKPDREKVEAFSASNPETLHQADYIAAHPLPASFAGTTYWGVHAFPATNSKGETRFIKFKVMPVGEEGRQAANEATAKPPDLLHGDLDSRIAARDIRFSVMALLDRPGDPVMDVTIRWPDEDGREALRLGTIVVTGVEANDACDEAVFNPANLAEGIGRPPDEMFAARRAAYAISRSVAERTRRR